MKTISFCLTLIMLSSIGYGQGIQGVITDEENQPLAQANVYLIELNSVTTSDDMGGFNFGDISLGTYHIQISYVGFETQLVEVEVTEESTALTIPLKKGTVKMNEVVVSDSYLSTQNQNARSITVVHASEMDKTGAFTVMDVIDKVPGVDAITTGPLVARPIIRGMSSNRVLTIVDGVRFETQQWDDEHGIGINELGVERIEIIKGPSSMIYGPEAMGGIIHFIDETPAPSGTSMGDFRLNLFSNNLGAKANLNLKGATDHFNWGVHLLGRGLSDYFYNGYEFRVPNTRLTEYGGKGHLGISKKWGSSRLSYLFNLANYGILDGKDIVKKPDGSIVNTDSLEKEKFPFETEAPFHFVMDHRIQSKTTILLGNSKLLLNLGFQSNMRTEHEELSGKKQGYNYVDMTLNSYTYNLRYYFPEWGKLSSLIGTQGLHKINRNSSAASTQLIPDAQVTDIGFYVLENLNFSKLALSLGARYDTRNIRTIERIDSSICMPSLSTDYSNISGAFSLSYRFTVNTIFRTSVSSGYRSPNLNELCANGVKLESLTYEIGNRDFKKETNLEVDAELLHKGKSIDMSVAAYINQINNFIYLSPTDSLVISGITRAPIVPIYQYEQDNARIWGGEASLKIHPFHFQWFEFETRFSTLTARRLNDERYLPMMPTNKIYNTLTLNLGENERWSNVYFRLGTMTALKQFKVAANEKKTPSYTLLHIGLGGKTQNFEYHLAVQNLLDRTYLDNLSRFRSYDIYGPGVNVSFSVKKYFNLKKSKKG